MWLILVLYPFTDALFTKLIESKAKEKYFSTIPNQKSQLDLAKKTSQDLLNEWTRKLITTLYVYSAPDKSVQKTQVLIYERNLKKSTGSSLALDLKKSHKTTNFLLKDRV